MDNNRMERNVEVLRKEQPTANSKRCTGCGYKRCRAKCLDQDNISVWHRMWH